MPRRIEGFSRGRAFFEGLVQEAVESLPEDLKAHLQNIVVLVEEDFREDPGEEVGEEGELLGLYHGIPHNERGFGYGNVLPDRIIIYQRPLERISRTVEELRENVRQTVIHEVGHYFGFDEEALAKLEGRVRPRRTRD